MDRLIQRKRSLKKIHLTFAIVLALVFAGYSILSDTSSSRINKGSVRTKTVQEGPFSVYVVGNGTVVPRAIDYVLPEVDGELIAVNVQSGDAVEKDQALFVIENRGLMAEYAKQEIALLEAKAALDAKAFELETQKLQLQKEALQAKAAHLVQAEEYQANKTLMRGDNPPVSVLVFRQSEIREEQLKQIYELESDRLGKFEASMQSQMSQFEARVDLAKNMVARMRERVDGLTLRAKRKGIVQDVELKPGQRVETGTVIGLISNPDEVYVRLKVSAVQGHRLEQGQTALVSVRGEEKEGKVVRIDPNVKGTTIDVDVELNDDVKLRSNMFVSGRIMVEELRRALYVDAPSYTVENGTSSFYKVSAAGDYIEMIKVETGLLSAGKVHVKHGLLAGDKIVVSDTGAFGGAERLALH